LFRDAWFENADNMNQLKFLLSKLKPVRMSQIQLKLKLFNLSEVDQYDYANQL